MSSPDDYYDGLRKQYDELQELILEVSELQFLSMSPQDRAWLERFMSKLGAMEEKIQVEAQTLRAMEEESDVEAQPPKEALTQPVAVSQGRHRYNSEPRQRVKSAEFSSASRVDDDSPCGGSMAIQSRVRGTRNGGKAVSKSQHPPPQKTKSQASGDRHTHHDTTTSTAPRTNHDTPTADNDGEPPSKRRKLSIRSKQQTTLDNWTTAQSGKVKPPTKITVAQPKGQLLETINGVRTTLDTAENEVCRPTPRSNTPRSTSRVPQPDLHLSTNLAKQEDKRTLRSQDDGPRLKSELAIYFPNYEDIIFRCTQRAGIHHCRLEHLHHG